MKEIIDIVWELAAKLHREGVQLKRISMVKEDLVKLEPDNAGYNEILVDTPYGPIVLELM